MAFRESLPLLNSLSFVSSNPRNKPNKYSPMKDTNTLPSFRFQVVVDSDSIEQVTGTTLDGNAAILVFTFSDGVSGWAELGGDGFFCATVENQSECFATVADTAEWLYPRLACL